MYWGGNLSDSCSTTSNDLGHVGNTFVPLEDATAGFVFGDYFILDMGFSILALKHPPILAFERAIRKVVFFDGIIKNRSRQVNVV